MASPTAGAPTAKPLLSEAEKDAPCEASVAYASVELTCATVLGFVAAISVVLTTPEYPATISPRANVLARSLSGSPEKKTLAGKAIVREAFFRSTSELLV